MFVGVVLFGLFHGLLLLPVLLGLIGPASHREYFRKSGVSRWLELDDAFHDQTIHMHNTLDIADNFNVDLYEHGANTDSIAKRISSVPLGSPPAKENLQLFLKFQNSVNNTQILDVTPSQINDRSTQSANGIIVQESSV